MKSAEVQLNEALQGLNPTQRALFNKQRKPKATCEVQLNLIEAILRGEVKEATPIRMHNGAADNGRLELFVEGDSFLSHYKGSEVNLTEASATIAKKEALIESVRNSCNCDEAGARVILGLTPKLPEGLTRLQAADYTFAVKCGISESDALKLAKMPNRF